MAGGHSLWEKYDTGDNLLFREADLQAPMKSELFRELFKLNSSLGGKLLGPMFDVLRGRLEATPLLDGLIGELPPAQPETQASIRSASEATRAGCRSTRPYRAAPTAQSEVYYDDEMIGQMAACPYCDRPCKFPGRRAIQRRRIPANVKESPPAGRGRCDIGSNRRRR